MKGKETVQALRCCAKGLGHDTPDTRPGALR